MFLKLYLIYTTEHPPVVDKDFIDTIFKTVCKQTTQGRPPSASNKLLREALTAFYDQHFKSLLPHEDQDLAYTHLNTVLDYSSAQLATVFENNVKMHYVEYVEAYVDCVWQKHDLISRIRRTRKTKRERDAAIRKLTGNLRDIKTDLLNVGGEAFRSHPAYHKWIREQKAFVLPAKARYQKDLLYYDLQCKPNDYYPAMLRMTEFVEQAGRRPRNFSPLRTSVIPKHICIDTTTLVHLLYDKELGMGKKSEVLTNGGIKRNQAKIWETMFRTDKQEFRSKDYIFNHMIDTDGVSACVLLIRRDLAGKKPPKGKKQPVREQYIDDLSPEEGQTLSDRSVVGIDPNMSDLLFCTNEDASKHFRYTQNQRRKEINSKRYERITLKEKRRTHNRVDGLTIEQWETSLSGHNHRTVKFDEFKAYIRAKLLVNSKIEAFYQQRIFRKLNLSRFWNTRKSEQWMLQRFKEMFGDPTDVVIGIGDWEQKKHRKFKEPVKGKAFRSLLRRGGFKVFLVDEFRTSCKCSHCQHEDGKCETFRVRLDPNKKKPDEKRHLRKVHGLLVCRKCERLWNRDVNSAINTARLTREMISGRPRPEYLSRQASQGTALNRGVTSTGGA